MSTMQSKLAWTKPWNGLECEDILIFRAAPANDGRCVRGLVEGEDAPDIVANTFLDQVTDEQLKDIGYSFTALPLSKLFCNISTKR
jgi:hypothetical protein